MHSIVTIARRELAAYFTSPIAYIVLSAFLGLSGYLFFDRFFALSNTTMDGFFAWMPILLVFFAPGIAMRLLAEERGQGTIEMLLTFPVRDVEVVLGKYLAALALLATGLVLSLPFALTVNGVGNLDWGPVLGGYLGTLLLGGTYLAVGMFASALSKNQIVALLVGIGVCFLSWALNMSGAIGGSLGEIVRYASPAYHFQTITRGVVELRSVVFYLSAIAIGLLATTQVLESRKWV